MIINYTFYGL